MRPGVGTVSEATVQGQGWLWKPKAPSLDVPPQCCSQEEWETGLVQALGSRSLQTLPQRLRLVSVSGLRCQPSL